MSAVMERISKQVVKLPVKSRLRLAEWLLEGAEAISESRSEKLWIAEIKRRHKKYLSGKMRFESAGKVFAELERAFAR